MRKWQSAAILAAVMVSFGCASSPPPATMTPANPFAALAGGEPVAFAAPIDEAIARPSFDTTGLPEAPWSSPPLAMDAVPSAVLSAWATADNRGVCAPVALATAGEARARVSRMIDGGWAVEFDRPGMPGLSAHGDACARCGRGVFGVAGTAMSPDELASDEGPVPTFADGSHLEVEPPADGEQVAAATLTINGQGCVYQVWSFLGEAHLRELVGGLRRVEVSTEQTLAAR